MRVRSIALAMGMLAGITLLPVAGEAAPVEMSPVVERWAAQYDAPGCCSDEARAVDVSPDGVRVYVTGGDHDYTTIAYDTASGAHLWATTYDSGCCRADEARALSVSPDGTRVFVTGTSATVAYDATSGAQVWVASHLGSCCGVIDRAYALKVSPDGSRVYVTGEAVGDAYPYPRDYRTVAYDAASGIRLWAAQYDGPANAVDIARALGVSPDGSVVFVAGESSGTGTQPLDYATVAYDALTGSQLWVARHDGLANADDIARALGVSPDGSRIYVTGASVESGTPSSCCPHPTDYATVAYDAANGTQLWVARYSGLGLANVDDAAHALDVSPDGSRVYVTGMSESIDTPSDYATVAYDAASGLQLWVARYNGPAHSYDEARALRVSPDGLRVYVTGQSAWDVYVFGHPADFATVAYDAVSGAELWTARYDGSNGSSDAASALSVSPDGSRLFVAGAVGVWNASVFGTVAYCTLAASSASAGCLTEG